MKAIRLIGPMIVDGEVRHPFENPLRVSNREATRLHDLGALAEEPGDEAEAETPEPDDTDGTDG